MTTPMKFQSSRKAIGNTNLISPSNREIKRSIWSISASRGTDGFRIGFPGPMGRPPQRSIVQIWNGKERYINNMAPRSWKAIVMK